LESLFVALKLEFPTEITQIHKYCIRFSEYHLSINLYMIVTMTDNYPHVPITILLCYSGSNLVQSNNVVRCYRCQCNITLPATRYTQQLHIYLFIQTTVILATRLLRNVHTWAARLLWGSSQMAKQKRRTSFVKYACYWIVLN